MSILGAILGGIGGAIGEKASGSSRLTQDEFSDGWQQDLPPELMQMLAGLFGGGLGGGGFQAGQAAQMQALNEAIAFDPKAYAKSVGDAFAVNARFNQQTQNNGVASQIGAQSTGNNSMVALLQNRINNDTAAAIAGAEADAYQQGLQYKTSTINDTGNALQSQILNLIGATRGASTRGAMNNRIRAKQKTSEKSGGGIGGFLKGFVGGLGS